MGDECKANISYTVDSIHLRERVASKGKQEASTAVGSNSNHYSSCCDNTGDISRTSWPELAKSVTFQRHRLKSKSANTTASDQQVVKASIGRGIAKKKSENLGSDASKSDIANSILTVQVNVSDAPPEATSCSFKTKGYGFVEDSFVNNAGTSAGLDKCCVRNTRQVRMSSWRRQEKIARVCNRTNESENYTSCDVRGVACEEVQVCDNYSDTSGTSGKFCDTLDGKMQLSFKHVQKTNLPEASLNEQGITTGESSIAVDTRSSQRKKSWKEEKKRLREEEIRRRMLAPKGQTVRLVSQKVLKDLLDSNTENVPFPTYPAAAPVMNEKEFPTVEESREQRMRLSGGRNRGVQHIDVQERIASCEKQVELKHFGSDSGDCVKLSSEEQEVVEAAVGVRLRNRKRKDPVQINLMNLIKTQPSRHNKGQGEKGSLSKVNSRTQKRDSVICYSGNQLDASNPERKRGKKREVPKKKKLSVLKSAILEERALRKKEGGVIVDSSTCINNTVLTGAAEIQGCLCVSETEEVMIDNNRKDGSVNITEVLNVTESLKEKLNLSTSYEATTLPENLSDGPESTEEMIHKVERGEDTCITVPSRVLPRGCTEELWRLSVHSRKFREYCNNSVTIPLNSAVRLLLKDIVKFQDRLYHHDPVKAFAKRRYVLGFREVMKYLHLKKLKLIVIAPDLEVSKQKGGIDDIVAQLKEESTAQGLACLFALSRRELGYLTFKKVGVSCIGICSYEGSESNFKDVVESLAGARIEYEQKTRHAVTVPTGGATNKPDDSTDAATTVTNQVIASLLSKLTESSSGDSAARLLSAIERAPILE